MSDTDDSQKTEEPTPKRLHEAKEQGNVASSKEVLSFMSLAAATLLAAMMSGYIAFNVMDVLRFYIAMPDAIPTDPSGLGHVITGTLIEIAKILIIPLMFLMLVGVMSTVVQTGFIFTGHTIIPSPDKISPMKGLKRLFGLQGIVETLKGMVKLVIVGTIAYVVIKPVIVEGEKYIGITIVAMLEAIRQNFLVFMTYVLFVFFFLAIFDFMYQRYQWRKKLKMSKQEIKDEYRQTEGDPKVKAKLKHLRIQKARERMMQNVPRADVVITNPTHYAIALEYKMETMNAPVCLAKGHDAVALRIRELATENKVPIVENPPLARALYATVELEEEIPEEHYQAVAKVISYVMGLKRR